MNKLFKILVALMFVFSIIHSNVVTEATVSHQGSQEFKTQVIFCSSYEYNPLKDGDETSLLVLIWTGTETYFVVKTPYHVPADNLNKLTFSQILTFTREFKGTQEKQKNQPILDNWLIKNVEIK